MTARSAKSHPFGHVDPNKLYQHNTSKVDPRDDVNSLTPEATICMAVCGHSFRRMAAKRGAARTKTLARYKEAGAGSKSLPSRCNDAIVEDRPVRNSDDISVFAVDDSTLTTK
jgi:hypothetical protein